jgi:hypothetical protein
MPAFLRADLLLSLFKIALDETPKKAHSKNERCNYEQAFCYTWLQLALNFGRHPE